MMVSNNNFWQNAVLTVCLALWILERRGSHSTYFQFAEKSLKSPTSAC